MARLFAAFNGPRFWVLFANLVTRGVGFATSFIIARISGAQALGEYSALVNTAATVIAPFLQVVGNNSTVLAVHACREGGVTVGRVAVANLLLAAVLAVASFPVFLILQNLALGGAKADESHLWLGLTAAGSVVVGQLCGAVLLGCCYGTGQFAGSSRVSIGVSLTVVVLVLPVVLLWGLAGAYATLAFASVAPPLALAYSMFRGEQRSGRMVFGNQDALRNAITQFRASLPSVAATAVSAAVYWLCTIYFVQRSFGIEGVGLVAVAAQWLTVMLLAATSWGGVSLKILTEAVASGDPSAVQKATFGLLEKNLAVTLAASFIVVLGAGWIGKSYGLGDSGLDLLLRLNAGCAVVGACNIIFERLLWAINRQSAWFAFSAAGFLVQVAITAFFIEAGLFVVVAGSLVGSMVLLLCCFLGLNRFLCGVLKAPA